MGTPHFAQAVAAGVSGILAHERFVDGCDLVTRLPPIRCGYQHAGVLRYIDCNGRLLTEPSELEMEKDRLPGLPQYWEDHALIRGTVNARGLADHAPINYLSGVLGLR